MKKFILLYLAPVSAEEQMNVSPEEMKKGMEPWIAYFGKYGSSIVDGGNPTGKGTIYEKGGNSKPANSQIAGYSIVQAENMDAVTNMLQDHPHYMLPGSSIEVHEIMVMPKM